MAESEDKNQNKEVSRRQFLKMAGAVAVGIGLGELPRVIWLDNGVAAIPASEGYILVDTKKCQGCDTCMLACSLVHEGKENLSLARIQVMQNPFEKFPFDLDINQCRQCTFPACVEACPTGALHAEKKYGNVRLVDERKCIGCQRCVEACPQQPTRVLWNFEAKHSQKCDLCANAPYWKNHKGGPDGEQACVKVCPVGAIKFTREIPTQTGDAGYKVNFRGEAWRALGWSTD
ncbi:MAG: 4Fe-4S dicluster domain-containing protein [Bacteroidota bacterium]